MVKYEFIICLIISFILLLIGSYIIGGLILLGRFMIIVSIIVFAITIISKLVYMD